MKAIIIFLLINYFLFSDTTIGYVDISKYDQNDSIHLAIVARSGKIDKFIYYGYSNEKSTPLNIFTYTKDTTSSESFCSGDDYNSYCGIRYY